MFLPAGLLPEDTIPELAVNCQKCGLAKQRSRIIWGEGHPEADLYVLLDNPGAREDKSGVPFVCGTRETLNRVLAEVGLDKENIYVTYVLRCRPTRKYDKDICRSTCLEYFWAQLKTHSPQLLVCLGNTAAQSFLNDKEAEIKHLRGRVIKHRGFPTAFSYHPLAIKRRPSMYNLFLEDWKLIRDRRTDRT